MGIILGLYTVFQPNSSGSHFSWITMKQFRAGKEKNPKFISKTQRSPPKNNLFTKSCRTWWGSFTERTGDDFCDRGTPGKIKTNPPGSEGMREFFPAPLGCAEHRGLVRGHFPFVMLIQP